ncbi:hypothetical protein K505DRAFT_226513, partial [Melanomma pulvis-pyrius CBS 109.77]
IEWDEAPLVHQYYQGLKEFVKDELARRERITDLDELVVAATNIDERFREKAVEKKQ